MINKSWEVTMEPKLLGSKLKNIRKQLGLSPSQLADRFQHIEPLDADLIVSFESGKNKPSLQLLLAYGRSVGVCTDYLADDKLKLPHV
jgi:DNA-binding XRE family transcriptional regulator